MRLLLLLFLQTIPFSCLAGTLALKGVGSSIQFHDNNGNIEAEITADNVGGSVTTGKAILALHEEFILTHPADANMQRTVSIVRAADEGNGGRGSLDSVTFYADMEEDGADMISGTQPIFTSTSLSTSNAKFGSQSLFAETDPRYARWNVGKDALNFLKGDFTVQFWWYSESGYQGGGFWANIIGTSSACQSGEGQWGLGMDSFGNHGGGFRTHFNNNLITSSTGFVYQKQTWYHIVWERVSGTMVLYVNGQKITDWSNSDQIGGAAESLYIGAVCDWDHNPKLYIDDVVIAKKALYRNKSFLAPEHAFSQTGPANAALEREPQILGPDSSEFTVTIVNDTATRIFRNGETGTGNITVHVHV